MRKRAFRQGGMTLVELTVALAVAAILAAIATPSLRDLVQSNRIAASNNGLITALHQARAEALRRGRRVAVCASANQHDCSGAGDWSTGWVVFEDRAVAGAPAAPAQANYDARMIGVYPPLAAGFQLRSQNAWYRYAPTGSLSWPAVGTGSESQLELRAGANADQQRCVRLNRIGRVRAQKGGCS
jgi:type IV fimbrial biogenesis protein FimT